MSCFPFRRGVLLALAGLLGGCGGPELWLVVTRPNTDINLIVSPCAADGSDCVDYLAQAFAEGDTALTSTVGLELRRKDTETFSLKLQGAGAGYQRCDLLVVPVEPRGRDITVRLSAARSPAEAPEVDCGGARCPLVPCLSE